MKKAAAIISILIVIILGVYVYLDRTGQLQTSLLTEKPKLNIAKLINGVAEATVSPGATFNVTIPISITGTNGQKGTLGIVDNLFGTTDEVLIQNVEIENPECRQAIGFSFACSFEFEIPFNTEIRYTVKMTDEDIYPTIPFDMTNTVIANVTGSSEPITASVRAILHVIPKE